MLGLTSLKLPFTAKHCSCPRYSLEIQIILPNVDEKQTRGYFPLQNSLDSLNSKLSCLFKANAKLLLGKSKYNIVCDSKQNFGNMDSSNKIQDGCSLKVSQFVQMEILSNLPLKIIVSETEVVDNTHLFQIGKSTFEKLAKFVCMSTFCKLYKNSNNNKFYHISFGEFFEDVPFNYGTYSSSSTNLVLQIDCFTVFSTQIIGNLAK